MLATHLMRDRAYAPRRSRRGMSVIFVLALISMTLALSYAMLRTQATIEQTERNTNHRATARQAAMTGMSVALRAITEPTWGGVDVDLKGNLGDGSTYAARFETGDASLVAGDPDYAEYPYRVTITSTGSVVDPANPQIQATHQVRSVVQLVRRKLADNPVIWPTIQPYTVYQWGTGDAGKFDITTPLHVEGPVFLQNKIEYLKDYPKDGDDKPFDGVIDEVMILRSAATASTLQAVRAGTLSLRELADNPTANAVAWWRFDEANGSSIAVDELGNYDGRYEGSTAGGVPSATQGGTGSAEFDGYDDHIDLAPIELSGNAMTIIASIKIDDFDHLDARIISKATGTSEGDTYWAIGTYSISGFKLLWFRVKTDSGGTATLYAVTGSLSPNTWHSIGAVYDGTTMELYENGQLVGLRSKNGTISSSPAVRVSIGNNPSGSPRARLLRDYEAMRVAGQGDFRPFSGPISAPLSLTSAHARRLLESDSNVTLNDVAIGNGTSPVAHPGYIPSYRLYPGGKVYSTTQLGETIANVSFAPDPKTNPLGLVTRQGELVIDDNVTIQGTVLVYDSGSPVKIDLRGTGINIAPLSLPSLYGDSTVYQLPSVIARDDVKVRDGSSSSLSGLVMAWDKLKCSNGQQSTEMSVTGQVIVRGLEVEARREWDQSASWWDSRHKEFLSQLDAASPIPYFPEWLKENHGLDYEPKLTIQPASAGVSYHWHDWSKPLFEAHPDDGGLRWDLLEWRDGGPP